MYSIHVRVYYTCTCIVYVYSIRVGIVSSSINYSFPPSFHPTSTQTTVAMVTEIREYSTVVYHDSYTTATVLVTDNIHRQSSILLTQIINLTIHYAKRIE